MVAIFRHTLSRFRGQILGWGISMLVLGLLVVSLFDTVVANQQQFEELIKAYPPEFSAFFGDLSTMATPEGFLSIEYFALAPVILGIFAVLAGSGLLASDEENGTLDLILAHPVSRTALFIGRSLAFVAATVGILALSWLGLVSAAAWSSLDIGWGALALPFLSLLAVLLDFGALALLLSMLLPSRRLAAATAGITLVASYFLASLSRLNEDLETIANLTPLRYYQSGDAIQGLNVGWFVGLLAASALMVLLAWWRFERRDIRVAGEGGWRLSWPGVARPRRA